MLRNRIKANTATTGTGSVAVGTAVSPYQTWASAGAVAGKSYSYLIEDGTAWEIGTGTYDGTNVSRPGPTSDSSFESSTGALLNLSGSATIACVANRLDYSAGTGGMQKLAEVTLAADSSVISFSAINQNYDDLVLVLIPVVVGNAVNNTLILTFNGDTGANYDWSLFSRFEGSNIANQTGGTAAWLGFQTTQEGAVEIEFFNYASTTLNEKHWRASNSAAGGGNYFRRNFDGVWHPAVTAAIGTITATYSSVLKAGTKAILYGRGGAAATASTAVNGSPELVAAGTFAALASGTPVDLTNLDTINYDYKLKVRLTRGAGGSASDTLTVQFGDTASTPTWYTSTVFMTPLGANTAGLTTTGGITKVAQVQNNATLYMGTEIDLQFSDDGKGVSGLAHSYMWENIVQLDGTMTGVIGAIRLATTSQAWAGSYTLHRTPKTAAAAQLNRGSGPVLLQSQTVSGVASVVFDNTKITGTYTRYLLKWRDYVPGTAAVSASVQVSPDNGTTWRTTGYSTSMAQWGLTTNFQSYNQNLITTGFLVDWSGASDATVPGNGEIELYNLPLASAKSTASARALAKASDGNVYDKKFGGYYGTAAEVCNAIRFLPSSGTFSGTFDLYGIP